jgi:hypothetical protein
MGNGARAGHLFIAAGVIAQLIAQLKEQHHDFFSPQVLTT